MALERHIAGSAEPGDETRIAKNGHAREGMLELALVYMQQLMLRAMLAGECSNEEERNLHRAVIEDRELISLRPLGLEYLSKDSFAPVLQYLGGSRWRVGLAEWGRSRRIR